MWGWGFWRVGLRLLRFEEGESWDKGFQCSGTFLGGPGGVGGEAGSDGVMVELNDNYDTVVGLSPQQKICQYLILFERVSFRC